MRGSRKKGGGELGRVENFRGEGGTKDCDSVRGGQRIKESKDRLGS